jgi:phosphonopyruvate decarboxylase
MLDPEVFYEHLDSCGINFFAGVPDSLLKDFCAVVTSKVDHKLHVITANEGNAIALASGYYAGTGKPALVYMQNSGLGNAINPILSLADKEVFSIPMLLMIGWRGQPGQADEPQHIKQGRVTTQILESLGVIFFELNSLSDYQSVIGNALSEMQKTKSPVAILVSKGTFNSYKETFSNKKEPFDLTREQAINIIADNLGQNCVFISTTGMTSRELYERRENSDESHDKDLYVVGSMGHASSIAMGVAIGSRKSKIICIDGDGSLLMHMGSLPIIGQSNLQNFFHMIVNNGTHDSVGGQPTVGMKINLTQIALASGYKRAETAHNETDLIKKIVELKEENGPIFLEVKVQPGARDNLGRPRLKPVENLTNYINELI